MLHFYDRATMAHALTLDLNPQLHRLLSDRIAALGEDLIDWTEYLVVEPGDTEPDIIRHIGLSPFVEPIDGTRFGEPGFEPGWDWLDAHEGYWEFVFTFGSTFACIVFVTDDEGVSSDILRLCRSFSRP